MRNAKEGMERIQLVRSRVQVMFMNASGITDFYKDQAVSWAAESLWTF
jgi:hypothetical protein